MAYSIQQQVANLTFVLHDLFDPATKSMRAIEVLSESTQLYSNFTILEAYLWLHLGVRLRYLPLEQSRRAVYEYANLILGAYQRIDTQKKLQKFSPPLERILNGELTGRVELFSSVEEVPEPSEELTSTFQNTLIRVGGLNNNAEVQQLLRMILFAAEPDWLLATGKTPNLPPPTDREEFAQSYNQWAQPSFFRVIQFMEDSRLSQDDLRKTGARISKGRANDLLLLQRRLKEMLQWRLDFGDERTRERFLEIARDIVQRVRNEIKEDEASRKWASEMPSLVAAVNDLLMDWGAPPFQQVAER